MFKLLKYSAMVLIILLSVARLSLATPITTWVDSVANAAELNNGHPIYTFTYNITGAGGPNVLSDPSNPFHPGVDVISAADLSLFFSFGTGNANQTLTIKLDGTDYMASVIIGDKNLGLQASAIAQLNANGTVDLEIDKISTRGDFGLTNSTLTATGADNTPTPVDPPARPSIPEPSTFLLLGAGLLSVGLVRKGMRR